MNTYVLVEDDYETSWYELVEEYSEEKVERLADNFNSQMAKQAVGGRQGLTQERMNKFLWDFISNVTTYLKEERRLLFNRRSGMMFLDENTRILKVVRDDWFPVEYKEGSGLSGWLTPSGDFHHCGHGDHWRFASEEMNSETDELRELQYVSMGSVGHDYRLLSHLFIPVNGLTEEQQEWFERNYKYLDEEQKRIYDLMEVIY